MHTVHNIWAAGALFTLARSEVLTTEFKNIQVFWDVTPTVLVNS